ncbi:MAG: 50S ribosomal protein L28 [Elusimicrobia bacterium HGW-Elusimicrobia-1]|jgi:large subunit ribosomal protein L28|nr:MAG: 50S ribosomal protein L28 [Elusimicrobia bacterium HGW-Elusimicrobia-3]PKN01838.1 MAG: 50S ribosomal protein L28 [Elusimicrobia bacterium HGW-Elusimicrobia-1]
MSFKCSICAKGPSAGKSISHSHKASNRRFMPNLGRHKIMLGGKAVRAYVCTTCLKSGRVRKAV